MIGQHVMAGTQRRDRPFAAKVLLVARRLGVPILIACGVGFWSVALGPDINWDLRYYHLYAPWAYLHHRYLYDIAPAQSQGFFNPTADLLFYGLISSALNQTPRVVAFIMGAVHGINAALIVAIARHVLRPTLAGERATLRVVAFLIGISGAGFVSLLGTTTNDLINSIFVLGSFLGLLKVASLTPERATWRGFAWAGLLGGTGLGLKYTTVVFFPALGLIALIAAVRRRAPGALILFGIAAILGFLAIAGHHLFTLWRDFGNPTFPSLNQIFQSPYYEFESLHDTRFRPRDILQAIAYPFYWARTNIYLVTEMSFRDWRGAIAYLAIAAASFKLAADTFYRRDRVRAQTCGLDLVFIFVVVSFFAWEFSFGIYRYGVALEMLTGVVAVGALIWLFEDSRIRVTAAVGLLAISVMTTVYPDWGRGQYGARYIDVRVPSLPPNSIVLLASRDPVAYFIPFAEPTVRYIGIENDYLKRSQNNALASEAKRILRAPGPAKFVLSVDGFDPDRLNGLLGQFGLALKASPCQPIWSNFDWPALSLCPVTEN
jgi:hypothetical protein